MTSSSTRSCVVSVRLPANNHESFVAAARRLREARSRLLRREIRALIGRPAPFYEHELRGLIEAIYQLKAIRRNLGQIVEAVHASKVSADLAVIESACAVMGALEARLADVVNASRMRDTP